MPRELGGRLAGLDQDPNAESKRRFGNAALVLLSAGNLVLVWVTAQMGPPWHPAVHAALALGFGWWAGVRMRMEAAPLRAGALDEASGAEVAALREEVGEMRRELGEVQERLDFTERLLTQAREAGRVRGRPES